MLELYSAGTYAQLGSGAITAPPDMAGPFANVGLLFLTEMAVLQGAWW